MPNDIPFMVALRERASRARDPRFFIVVSLVLVCLALAVTGAWAADATIRLYQDEFGYSCSFNNEPGIFTAYVIVTPGTGGTRGVRFSAPVPSCFDATYLTEEIPSLVVGVGSSQTGISLSHRDCQTAPFNVLKITYFNNGGTTPCCEYPILPDTFTGTLEAVDCVFAPQPIVSDVAYFNADATCADCGPGAPPIPTNPTPPDLAIDRPLNQMLAWEVLGDAENLTYDVYFGTSVTPPLVASNLTPAAYDPGALEPGTIYYWIVVTHGESGAEYPGPLWTFDTVDPPFNPFPANFASNVPLTIDLAWDAPNPVGLTFDVYFGTDYPPPLVATNITESNYNPGLLAYSTTYFWRIVARDPLGVEASGPIWTFITDSPSLPPYAPHSPSPFNGMLNASLHPTLQWQAVDPEGFPLTFDGYFGTAEPLVKIFSNRSGNSFALNGLLPTTRYYWRIVARDDDGLQTIGPTWTFVTKRNTPPINRFRSRPVDGATGQPVNTTLSWLAFDIDAHPLTYDVYFGTGASPPLVAANHPVRQYFPGIQSFGTVYFWRIVAIDPFGAERSSPVWSYTTRILEPNAMTVGALELTLHQNVPNPFNPQTTIRYDIPAGGATRVRLMIVDTGGRVVRTLVDENQGAGTHEVRWVGQNDRDEAVASGVYFYVLDVDGQRLTKKLVLLK